MKNNRTPALKVAQGAIIAALYVVLTVIFAPISFGEMQVRISEALTILPMFTPAAIPGLFVGCVLGNLLGGAIPVDVIFGSLATLIGAVGGYLLRKNRWLVPLPTVLHGPFQRRHRALRAAVRLWRDPPHPPHDGVRGGGRGHQLLCAGGAPLHRPAPAQEHLRAGGRERAGSINIYISVGRING